MLLFDVRLFVVLCCGVLQYVGLLCRVMRRVMVLFDMLRHDVLYCMVVCCGVQLCLCWCMLG